MILCYAYWFRQIKFLLKHIKRAWLTINIKVVYSLPKCHIFRTLVFRRLIEWFACARLSESYLPRSYAVTFPKRSPPWLFTSAALGGLKPAPASRLRGAFPHLLCSYAHFMKKCARGALYWEYLSSGESCDIIQSSIKIGAFPDLCLLASTCTIHNNNWYTDIIFFWPARFRHWEKVP